MEKKAQSVIEYILLVIICLAGLLGGGTFINYLKEKSLENHYRLIESRITGDIYIPK